MMRRASWQPQRRWTPEENKAFEEALACFGSDEPDRWRLVADMLPGKTVYDVVSHYQDLENDVSHIEAGLVPCPLYDTAPAIALNWDTATAATGVRAGKRGRGGDHERKKGVPWTEDEHKLFLLGLMKYGRGDWRSISRNFVTTRTSTQVASHAQKYFLRLNSGSKDRRRSSIHDITTVNLPREEHGSQLVCLDSKPRRAFTDYHQATNGFKLQAMDPAIGLPSEDAMFLHMLQLQ